MVAKKTSLKKSKKTSKGKKGVSKSVTKATGKNKASAAKSGNLKTTSFYDLLEDRFINDSTPDVQMIKKGQYKEAFELLEDSQACQLTPILVGPPGTGKTLLARTFATSQNRDFEWLTMDEATKPSHFIGSFDPGETLKRGFVKESFSPGTLTKMMVTGGIFLANELNRATEYCQNTFLEPLEERSLMLPRLGRIQAEENFFLICAANPGDIAGTHRISEALKDRIKVWIKLAYPTRVVEMEIIKSNVPSLNLSKDYLGMTYDLIAATRKAREIERPASIRSAIAIAKLAGQKKRVSGGLSIGEFQKIARLVLVGGVKTRPGHEAEAVIGNLIKSIAK